jgi:hypothetical protein
LLRGVKVADEGRHVKPTDIPDHGASVAIKGSLLLLIQLIIHEEMRLLGIQPALVRVLGAGVAIPKGGGELERGRGGGEVPSDEFDGILVSDINDGERVLVVIETDLVLCVG